MQQQRPSEEVADVRRCPDLTTNVQVDLFWNYLRALRVALSLASSDFGPAVVRFETTSTDPRRRKKVGGVRLCLTMVAYRGVVRIPPQGPATKASVLLTNKSGASSHSEMSPLFRAQGQRYSSQTNRGWLRFRHGHPMSGRARHV